MEYTFFVPTVKEAAAIFGSGKITERDGFLYLIDTPHTVVIAGFGKVNAAVTLTKYLYKNLSYGMPVLMGIAGAYREAGLTTGDIVMIKNDYFVDEALLTDDAIKGTDELGFPVCDSNKTEFCTPFRLPLCDANTVSLLSGTDYLAQLYQNKTGAAIESMEGAAFALAAASFGIKTAQVRAVSNYCGARKNQDWNAGKALTALRNFIVTLSHNR